MLTEAWLIAIAQAVFATGVLEQAGLAQKACEWLRRDPSSLAFQVALARAYSTFEEQHPEWTASLLDGYFLKTSAAPLLARCLTRDNPPTPPELAAAWVNQVGYTSDVREQHLAAATPIVGNFLRLLTHELRARNEFQPLFDARALDAIAVSTAQTTQAVDLLRSDLRQVLAELRYTPVYQIVIQHYPSLKDYIYTFDAELRSSRWFVGREFVFTALADFQTRHPCGYFRVIADAGLGKTALAAEIARRYNASVFFANRSGGRTRTHQCLNHLSADLIARFGLEHNHLPPRAGEDSTFFSQILAEAVEKAGGLLWVVVDALDEADDPLPGQNPLLLPDHLPQGVYVVLTHRSVEYTLMADSRTPIKDYEVRGNDPVQQADIEVYIRRRAVEQTLIAQALTHATPPIPVEMYVTRLKAASQGNFKYLEYVLADITAGETDFHPLDLSKLPNGLIGYYAQFWSRLEAVKKDEGWTEWNGLYRPVIELLGAAREPVTAQWLANHTGRDPDEIRERALLQWQRFLSRERQQGEEMWRVIHQSFADFLEEKVNLIATHQRVAGYYVNAGVELRR